MARELMLAKLVPAEIGSPSGELIIARLPAVLGRGDEVELPVRDTSVSRRHCAIDRVETTLVVEDLGSSQGTFVNGVRIDRSHLMPGDRLTVGRIHFVASYERPLRLPLNAAQGARLEDSNGGALASELKRFGVSPAVVFAVEKTGLLLGEDNWYLVSKADLQRWFAAIDEYKQRQGWPKESLELPIGTMALYGPDAIRTTKIVVGVVDSGDAEPIVRSWEGAGVQEDKRVQAEIHQFLAAHQVKTILATPRNIGCPHEADGDFPPGSSCPRCPHWRSLKAQR